VVLPTVASLHALSRTCLASCAAALIRVIDAWSWLSTSSVKKEFPDGTFPVSAYCSQKMKRGCE